MSSTSYNVATTLQKFMTRKQGIPNHDELHGQSTYGVESASSGRSYLGFTLIQRAWLEDATQCSRSMLSSLYAAISPVVLRKDYRLSLGTRSEQ